MKTLLLSALTLISSLCFGQTAQFDWVRRIGNSGTDCAGQIANDSAGNLYASGLFVGQLVFGVDTLTSTNISNSDIFIAKYDTAGQPLWARKAPLNYGFGVCGGGELSKLRVSPSGRAYLLGGTGGSINREYLAVYRPGGSLVGYANQVVNNRNEDVDFDSVDNAYIVGTRFAGVDNAFVFKVDSSGTTKWSYIFSQESRVSNVKYSAGKVYITGQFRYQLQLTDTVGSSPITLNAGGGINDWDFFCAVYSSNGKLLSATRSNGLVAAPAGPFEYSSDFTAANRWNVAVVNTANNALVFSYSTSLTTMGVGNLGTLSCPFPPIAQTKADRFHKQSVFAYAGLLCNSTGASILDSNTQLIRTVGAPYAGPANTQPIRDFSFDTARSLYILSDFTGSISYRDNTGTHTLTSNSGSMDVYVAKYHTCNEYNPQISKVGDTLFCSTPGMVYRWLNGTATVATNTLGYCVPTVSGNYSVVVSDNWGCTDTSAVMQVSVPLTSVSSSLPAAGPISLYPNPATGTVTISGLTAGQQIRILDMVGRTVITSSAKAPVETVWVGALGRGVYALECGETKLKFSKE